MDDLDLVIDGTTVQVHATDGGKVVFSFPEETNAKVTVDPGDVSRPTVDSVQRLGAALLSALRSAGFIRQAASNPQNPSSRQVDSIQGFASN